MKKLFTILTVVAITATITFAQSEGDLKFGIFTGANYAIPVGSDMDDLKDDIDDMIDDADDNGFDAEGGVYGRLGFHLGFNCDYYIKDNFAITSSLSYSQKGFNYNVQQDFEQQMWVGYYDNNMNYYEDYVTLDNSQKNKIIVQLDYLDLPIGVKYQDDNGFNVFGGLLFSFLVNQNVKYEYEYEYEQIQYEYNNWNNSYESGYSIVSDSDSDSDSDDYDDTIDDDDPNSTLTGFQLGVGYSNDRFNVAFKLNRNSNFGDMDGYGDDNKNLTLQLSTGVYF